MLALPVNQVEESLDENASIVSLRYLFVLYWSHLYSDITKRREDCPAKPSCFFHFYSERWDFKDSNWRNSRNEKVFQIFTTNQAFKRWRIGGFGIFITKWRTTRSESQRGNKQSGPAQTRDMRWRFGSPQPRILARNYCFSGSVHFYGARSGKGDTVWANQLSFCSKITNGIVKMIILLESIHIDVCILKKN